MKYSEQIQALEQFLDCFLAGGLSDLPPIITGESGSGKSRLVRLALERAQKTYFRFLPEPDMDYGDLVEVVVQKIFAKYSEENFAKFVFWFDECQNWKTFKPEFIQAEKGTLRISGIHIRFDQLIFSGHSTLLQTKSDKARLRELTCQTPLRKDILSTLKKDKSFQLPLLTKTIEYSGTSFHEVLKNYRAIQSGLRLVLNPLGLSDNAFKLLSLYANNDGATVTTIKSLLSVSNAAFKQYESELEHESLIYKDSCKRFVSKLGFATLKAPKLDTKSLKA